MLFISVAFVLVFVATFIIIIIIIYYVFIRSIQGYKPMTRGGFLLYLTDISKRNLKLWLKSK